jgi:hypothetical protein
MFNKLFYFGIIKNNEGEIINHRTLIKVVFNPILRIFGVEIVSIFREGNFIRSELPTAAIVSRSETH